MKNHCWTGGRFRGDLRLISRLFDLGVDIPKRAKEKVAQVIDEVLSDPGESSRNKLAAARCLVAIERLKLDAILALLNKAIPSQVEISDGQTEHNKFEVARMFAKEIQGNPAYLDFLRDRAAKRSIAKVHDANGRKSSR